LRKLEKLQAELHKTISDWDRFFGGFTSLGTSLGSLGKEGKPFLDYVVEILRICLGAQQRVEKLPMPPEFPAISSAQPNDNKNKIDDTS